MGFLNPVSFLVNKAIWTSLPLINLYASLWGLENQIKISLLYNFSSYIKKGFLYSAK